MPESSGTLGTRQRFISQGMRARRKASPKPPTNEWVIPRWYSMYCSGVRVKKTSISGEAATSAAHAGSHQRRFPGRAQPMTAPLKACVIGSIAFLILQKKKGKGFFREKPSSPVSRQMVRRITVFCAERTCLIQQENKLGLPLRKLSLPRANQRSKATPRECQRRVQGGIEGIRFF